MTAESIVQPTINDPELIQGLGSIVLPRVDTERLPMLNEVDDELRTPKEGSRAIGLLSTLIKERFQLLSGNMQADERDVRRAQLREESVRLIFKTLNLLPGTNEIDEQFSHAYRTTEAATDTMDKQKLVDLTDKYEDHPAIKVFDTLSHTASLKSDDVVYMRRTSLVLIDSRTS